VRKLEGIGLLHHLAVPIEPAESRAEVEKMIKVNPAITLQTWRLGYSFRDPAILDHYSLDLMQSGLPEK
jgi:hypothetical protein